jgi:thiol-disulfide isomerase/thioredoxin
MARDVPEARRSSWNGPECSWGFRSMAIVFRPGRALAAAAVLSLLAVACGTSSPTGVGDEFGAGPAAEPESLEDSLAQVFSGASTLDGANFDGAELAAGPVVLWFWAPWCTSCRAEGPRVAEVAEAYAGTVRVIGVPGRGQVQAMHQFVDDTGTGALEHVVDDDGSIWTAFGVFGQPAFAFLDGSDEIEVFVGTLGSAFEDRVAALAAT